MSSSDYPVNSAEGTQHSSISAGYEPIRDTSTELDQHSAQSFDDAHARLLDSLADAELEDVLNSLTANVAPSARDTEYASVDEDATFARCSDSAQPSDALEVLNDVAVREQSIAVDECRTTVEPAEVSESLIAAVTVCKGGTEEQEFITSPCDIQQTAHDNAEDTGIRPDGEASSSSCTLAAESSEDIDTAGLTSTATCPVASHEEGEAASSFSLPTEETTHDKDAETLSSSVDRVLLVDAPSSVHEDVSTNEEAHQSENMKDDEGDRAHEERRGSESSDDRILSGPSRTIMEMYHTWCSLLDNPEESCQLELMLQLLSQGGESFRSFVQFMARMSEPHRSGDIFACDSLDFDDAAEAAESTAAWRSCNAMRVACHAFAALNVNAGSEVVQILNLVSCELLRGLEPHSKAASMHVSIVLQHLMGTHDLEVCTAMLQNHAPFVLIRALESPGCKELLLGLLLGIETPLPPLISNQTLRPLSSMSLQQVLEYVEATGFAVLLATLLDRGARKTTACGLGVGSPASCSPAPMHRSWQSPGTPSMSGWPSPGASLLTPQRLATPMSEGSPLLALPVPPSSPSPSILPPSMELAELAKGTAAESEKLQPLPESPKSPTALDDDVTPCGSPELRCSTAPSCALHSAICLSPSPAKAPLTPVSGKVRTPLSREELCTPGRKGATAKVLAMLRSPAEDRESAGSPQESDAERGVSVLIEFLSCVLEMSGRAAEQLQKSKNAPDRDAKMRGELRLQMLQVVFVESPMIPNLFKLLQSNCCQYEAANLLHALLVSSMHPTRGFGALVEPLFGHFLPHVAMLGNLLRGGSKGRGSTAKKREVKLSAYTVREPLGGLCVSATGILAALVNLAPERTLAAMKPAVWTFLVQSFLTHRCNHIFQAPCSRLFVAAIHYGTPRLQTLLLSKLKLLPSICDIVLAEGACGDRWHEVHVQPASKKSQNAAACETDDAVEGDRVVKSQTFVINKRHPGGLGSITPIILALARVQRDAADEAEAAALLRELQETAAAKHVNDEVSTADSGDTNDDASRQDGRTPLGPRVAPQATVTPPREDDAINFKSKGHVHQFIPRALAESTHWPAVVCAISQSMPATSHTTLQA